MRKIFIFFIILALVSAASSFIILSKTNSNSVSLGKGKNYITINSSETLYARELVLKNPKIQSVSYLEGNTTRGYVNVFGGIGENFMIEPGRVYEISAGEEINLLIGGEE